MPGKQQGKNPFQVDKAISRLMKILKEREEREQALRRKQWREETEFPGFTPATGVPPGEKVMDAPGYGPPRMGGPQASLRTLTDRARTA